MNQVQKMNANNRGPWVTQTKQTLIIKLVNYQGKSIGLQIAVPQLCNLPNLMTNFNQLVLQEFEIQKLFVCFDMPLSILNKV